MLLLKGFAFAAFSDRALALIILPMRALLITYFVIIFFYSFPQAVRVNDTLELWSEDLGDFMYEAAFRITCNNWNLKCKFVTDTLDEEGSCLSCEEHNRFVWNALFKKGIKEPERKFMDECGEEFLTIKSAIEILSSDPNFNKLYPIIRAKKRELFYKVLKNNDSIYIVEMYSYQNKHLEKLILEQKFTINIMSKKLNN